MFRSPGAQMTRAQRRRWIGVFAACLALTAPAAEAAPPQADTVAAWRAYIQATEQRIARELASPDGFLVQDFSPSPESTPGALKRGDIGVVRMASLDRAGGFLAVPNGMVHHWRGSVFIPGTTLDEVLARVQNPTARDMAPTRRDGRFWALPALRRRWPRRDCGSGCDVRGLEHRQRARALRGRADQSPGVKRKRPSACAGGTCRRPCSVVRPGLWSRPEDVLREDLDHDAAVLGAAVAGLVRPPACPRRS